MRSVNALRTSRRDRGFTLIELMVVVAIIGVLAAIAIPSFQNYQNRSRRSEALTNLAAIAKMEKAYFGEYNSYTEPIQGEPYLSTSLAPTTNKRPWSPAADLTFSQLGWRPEGDVYYDYDVNTEQACPDRDCFTAAAYGDADGDGNMAVIQYVQPNAAGLTELTLALAYGTPIEPVSGRTRLHEVAVNYDADDF